MIYYHYYWVIPLVTIIGVCLILLAIGLMIKHRRRDHTVPIQHHSGVSILRIQNPENVPPTNQENVHKDLNKCMVCENNLTYWRLNCGGTLCNNCIVKFSSALSSYQVLHCPQCSNPILNFTFMNRYVAGHDREMSRIENSNPFNFEENSGNTCNICHERVCDKRINCDSPDHFLCYICYDRLINVQKILLCPYCRTLIKNAINDEEAPVVLGS